MQNIPTPEGQWDALRNTATRTADFIKEVMFSRGINFFYYRFK
jgi:hypothetical protein